MIKVMSNLMINDELHMVYPDSFHVMDEHEQHEEKYEGSNSK